MNPLTIWVVVEISNGSPSSTSLEILSHARSLGAQVSAIAWGDRVADASEIMSRCGTRTIYDVGPLHGVLPGAPISTSISRLIATYGAPEVILVPTSYDGRDIAGRLSALLDQPVLSNVTGLSYDDGFVTEHPVFGGTSLVKARIDAEGPGIILIRAKSFPVVIGENAMSEVIEVPAIRDETAQVATIIASHVELRSGPQLEDATVVVSGGRGLGNASQYALIEELAILLRGAPGASRAIVDSGWVPYSYQVGQTGKTVKPDVYLAFGISGATQHMVGMKGSRHIVAVNKDPDAPIFQVADLGIVGDVHQVLPSLIAAIKKSDR